MSEYVTVTMRGGHIDEILSEGDEPSEALRELRALLLALDEEERAGEDFTEPVFLLDVETAETKEIII